MEGGRTAKVIWIADWNTTARSFEIARGLAARAEYEDAETAASLVRAAARYRRKTFEGAADTDPLAAHG